MTRCDCGTPKDANGCPACRAIDEANATIRAKVAARKAKAWREGVDERAGVGLRAVRAGAARAVPGEAQRQREQAARVKRGMR